MNIIDIGIILLILLFGIVGFKKGALKEIVSLVGLILVFIIAWHLKGTVGNYLCTYAPFINFTGSFKGLITLNILLYQSIAFFIVASLLFIIYSILLKLSGLVEKVLDMTIILAIPSKIIGFIIGLVEGYIVVFIIILALLLPLKEMSLFRESTVVSKIAYASPILSSNTKSIGESITKTYKLADNINSHKISVNKANLELLDIMLKCKVVTKKDVQKLVILDKLKGVKKIDSVLSKY